MDHFGPLALAQVTTAVIEDYIDAALREREQIERAAAAGEPLMETVTDVRGAPSAAAGAAWTARRSTRSSRPCGWCSRTRAGAG